MFLFTVNSLQLDSTGQNKTGETQPSTMKLEFRWDFVVIYFIIMTLQGNFIYSMKYYFRKQVEKASCSKLQASCALFKTCFIHWRTAAAGDIKMLQNV